MSRLRKIIGQKSGYDLTFITKVDAPETKIKALKEKIEKIISDFKGSVVEWQELGRKKLAFTISKETRGNYHCVVFTGTGDVIAEIERNLRISEDVIRFLSIRISDNFDEAKYRTLIDERKRAIAKEQEDFERGGSSKDDKKMMAGKFARKKDSRLTAYDIKGYDLDYKDTRLLQSFMSEHGRMVPGRVSGNSSSGQRKLTRAIKRARTMALIGYVGEKLGAY